MTSKPKPEPRFPTPQHPDTRSTEDRIVGWVCSLVFVAGLVSLIVMLLT